MDRAPHVDALAELENGIRGLTTSALWRDFLRMQTTFHSYSYRNALLILRQRPEATQVTGFRSWRSLGRSVMRGERAIWILAPRNRPGDRNEDRERPVGGFVSVPVFDVSQTTGRPLPEVCQRLLGMEGAVCLDGLTSVASHLGFRVEFTELSDGVNGECSSVHRLIRIERRNASAQMVKSLAHELAHAILHGDVPDRLRAELEAESAAFIICRRLGIETGGYSFGYVASWAGGGDRAVAEIWRSCDRIVAAVDTVLGLYHGSSCETLPSGGHPGEMRAVARVSGER